MSKALNALHQHLGKVSRTKTRESEIIRQMERHMDAIIMGLIKLSRHTQNRIAAHKAHTTMAKQCIFNPHAKGRAEKLNRKRLPWSPDDRVVITKKGEAALCAAKKLKVVKIKGV